MNRVAEPNSLPCPAEDFPPECAHLYPAEFRYPVGYLAKPARVTDPALLAAFPDWQRPFVIHWQNEVQVDPHVNVAIGRLLDGKIDTSVKSALRALEWEGDGDAALQESFALEDRTEEAGLWSQAGMHEKAIGMIRQMPRPFQETGAALVALKTSLMALHRHAEALEEIRKLVHCEDITAYARELYRIEEAQTLLHLGRREEAEAILDTHEPELSDKWAYYGMRAAFALADGETELAKNVILRGGRLDNYHAYKMLWNPHLRPLHAHIRAELLTEDQRPRFYQQNANMLKLCHRVQGLVLQGRRREGLKWAEGFMLHHITDGGCTRAYALALTGLGFFDVLREALHVLPGRDSSNMLLVLELARFAADPVHMPLAPMLQLLPDVRFDPGTEEQMTGLIRWMQGGGRGPLPPEPPMILADVAPECWDNKGRAHFLLVQDFEQGFRLQRYYEDHSVHDASGWQLPCHFPVLEDTVLSPQEAFAWLEEKLVENDGAKDNSLRRVWSIHLNGWAMTGRLKPDAQTTPFMAEALRLAELDPNFYHHNGPAHSSNFYLPFGDMLVLMLRQALVQAGTA